MNIEKMREEFELKYPVPFACCWHSTAKEYWLLYDEHAGDEEVEQAIEQHNDRFRVWQSCFQSIEVDLPSDTCIRVNCYTIYETKDVCRKAIEAAGLKVAP